MNRIRLLVSESVRSLGANLSTTVAATMTVLIGMFLLGLLIAFRSYVVSYTDSVKEGLLVKAYFDADVAPQQINTLRAKLEADRRVKVVEFVSAEEALKRMRERYPDLTRNLSSNPLPASFEIRPHRGEDTKAIAETLRPLPAGVNKVDYGRKAASRILRFSAIVQSISLAAVLVLLGSSMLLIANTIRLSIFSRRREVEVMKLVGATNWFVRGPFMLEGLLCGLIGAAAAVLLLLLGRQLVLPTIGWFAADPDVQAWPLWMNAIILIGVGLAVGVAASGVTLRRFLRV